MKTTLTAIALALLVNGCAKPAEPQRNTTLEQPAANRMADNMDTRLSGYGWPWVKVKNLPPGPVPAKSYRWMTSSYWNDGR